MKPPVRLLEDPRTGAALRADLERTRELSPPYDLTRGLEALEAALAQHGSAGRAAGDHGAERGGVAAGRGTALSWTKAGWLLKGLAALGGAGSIALGVWAWPQAARQLRPRTGATASREVAPYVEPAQVVRQAPTTEPRQARETPPAERAPRVREAASPTDLGAAANASAPSASASRREIAQLLRIKQLLARDPAAALRLAEASQRAFPHGALREERESLRLLALWRLGAHERAQRAAEQFLARYPHSASRERVGRILAGEGPP